MTEPHSRSIIGLNVEHEARQRQKLRGRGEDKAEASRTRQGRGEAPWNRGKAEAAKILPRGKARRGFCLKAPITGNIHICLGNRNCNRRLEFPIDGALHSLRNCTTGTLAPGKQCGRQQVSITLNSWVTIGCLLNHSLRRSRYRFRFALGDIFQEVRVHYEFINQCDRIIHFIKWFF